MFACDRLSFTREREPGLNNRLCPELHDVHARDGDHVTSSHAHWISESMRGPMGTFHESTRKCGLNNLYPGTNKCGIVFGSYSHIAS